MTIKQLRAERETLTKTMSTIAGTERAAGTGMTDEEKRAFDEASTRVKEIDGEINRLEELRSLTAEMAVAGHDDSEADEFRSFLRGQEVRSQTVGTDSAGGFTVGATVAGRVITALKSTGGMIESASAINTATGGDLSYPTLDDTDSEAVIKSEGDARRNGPDVVFGSINLGAFTYDSGIIKISNQLVEDSAVDIESIVIDALSKRIGRKLQKDFTIGAGTTEPSGIITQTTLGVTSASATDIIADELLDLQFSVDEEYAKRGKYQMNRNTLLSIAKLKDSNGDYLITSATDGIGKRLFGKPVVVNNNLPDMATGTKPVIFGDLSAYMVRNVQGLNIFRFNELYQETNEIGFKASGRFDGTLLDPSAVKHLLMA